MPKTLKMEINIREKEVLRYLKYDLNKTRIDDKIINLVRNQIKRGQQLISPRFRYKILKIIKNDSQKVILKGLIIKSKNVAKLLQNSEKAVVFTSSIGPNLEKEIKRLFAQDEPTKAVILDAVGSEAVEAATDSFQKYISRGFCKTTPRFSPGYGDWQLKTNKNILKLLGAGKIGVKVSPKYMLIPQKTVTGVWGLVRNEKR